jgi:hypothetical protein
LRQLFCTILIGNTPRDPNGLLDRHFAGLSDDIRYLLWRKFAMANPSEDQIRSYCLFDLEDLLQLSGGKTLSDFHLPIATVDFNAIARNETMGRLIVEEQSYDEASLKADWERGYNMAIPEQKQILDRIVSAVDDPTSFLHNTRLFFIDGPGGTGKTLVENLLLAYTRLKHKIALAVASSGIASVLLTGGRTSHSRFKIPLLIDAESTCNISAQSDLARLLKMTTMIIWDEAPAQHRHCFEAVNRTLQDIRQSNEWFGGITTVFSGKLLMICVSQILGDFRQCLPVIVRASRPQLVASSIAKSKFWKNVEVLRLTKNMRLLAQSARMTPTEYEHANQFAEWLLEVGDGKTDHGTKVELPEGIFTATFSRKSDFEQRCAFMPIPAT